MKFLKLIVALLVTLLALTGCGGVTEGAGTSDVVEDNGPQYGGVLNMIIGKKDDHMDVDAPGASVGTQCWTKYVYESALSYDDTGKIHPLVCEFEYDTENFKWLKMWVREGVTFHDGTAVTIEDVKASYERNTRRDLYADLESQSIENGVWTLNYKNSCVESMNWYADQSGQYGIMPKWICEKFNLEENKIITDPAFVIGTGCYKIIPEEYVNQDIIVLERYDDYKMCTVLPDDNVSPAGPRHAYLDKINLILNSDQNNCLMHFLNGDYDVIYSTSDVYQSTLQPMGYKMFRDESGKTTADQPNIIFNMHDNSTSIVAKDKNLRRAILAAVDMEECAIAGYMDWYTPIHSPIVIDGYSMDAYNNQDYCGKDDIDLCNEYLAKSNYNGEELVLRAPSSGTVGVLRMVSQNLSDAGIKNHIELIDTSTYINDYRDGTSGWDIYMTFGAGSISCVNQMPVNNYVCWTNDDHAQELIKQLFSYPTGTPESIALWEEYSAYSADEANCFTVCKSLGDRFVQHPELVPNYRGYSNYRNAYWTAPSKHGAAQ